MSSFVAQLIEADKRTNTNPKPKTFTLPAALDIEKCANEKPPVLDFVLPGFLAGTVGSLISPGGAGKSMLTLELACEIAAGQHHLTGIQKKSGKVLYLAGEDCAQVLHHRIHNIIVNGRMNSQAVSQNLDLMPVNSIDLANSNHTTAISKHAQDYRLIIFDTLRRFHSKDENCGEDMVNVISDMEAIARNTSACILFLHHASKSAALNNNVAQQQACRGSSVLTDNCRWQSFLACMPEKEAKKMNIQDRHKYIKFGISKMNYAAPFHDLWFERGNGGVLIQKEKWNQRVKTISEHIAKAKQNERVFTMPDQADEDNPSWAA